MSNDETRQNRDLPADDDVVDRVHQAPSIGDVIARRFDRREMLRGALAVPVSTALFGASAMDAGAQVPAAPTTYRELASGIDHTHHVAEGYTTQVLLRWGDPLKPGLAPFDPMQQSAAEQEQRFGYNNDYIAFFPIDASGNRGLLCVNHEYTQATMMFAGLAKLDRDTLEPISRAMVDTEVAAQGVSVVEVARQGDTWRVLASSPLNRRITAATPMTADGPAAGHARLRTSADPTGLDIRGTFNNCGGGHTPWGTYLTGEENINGYFWTDQRDKDGRRLTRGLGGPDQKYWERYRLPAGRYNWGRFRDRFNVDKEPNEPNRFGWIVEIDPTDPTAKPVKKTAMGRFFHECAETVVNKDGRVVVYSGDDATFEYVYRFVSRERFIEANRAHNMRLLSDGTLSVARFDVDGSMTWLPLVFGTGPLTPANGFESQAEVLIYARLAADLLGATPMDRPEDVQPTKDGRVFVLLTNNNARKPDRVNAANPRAENAFGHILELTAPDGDHGADKFGWQVLVKCGDPRVSEVGALWNPATSEHGWFASPDNIAVDADGRLWVATDQGRSWPKTGKADGLYSVEATGASRGTAKLFFRVPVGAELCGPCFTPDGENLFLAVQHPSADGTKEWKPFGRESTFEDPATRWPDFRPDMPPRPSLLVVRKIGGGRIGS
jgi:uncharacterized protein